MISAAPLPFAIVLAGGFASGETAAQGTQAIQGALGHRLHRGQVIQPDFDHHHHQLELKTGHAAAMTAASHRHDQRQQLQNLAKAGAPVAQESAQPLGQPTESPFTASIR